MKTQKLTILLFCLTTMICQAQFPAPHSLMMFGKYIMIGDSGYCCGKEVMGATYCTDFQWETPDVSETEAQLTGYNIYYYNNYGYYNGMEIPFSEATRIAQTANTYFQMEIGIIGAVWVTAVYSNPEGESEPSNIVDNGDLPIAIKKVEKQPFTLTYNEQKNGIEIKDIENISSLRIFRLDGTEIMSVSSSDFHFIDTKGIEKGVYIVKITTKDAKLITEKIIIK